MINEEYAKKYCCEDISNIENYELAINDHTQTWECHHILGEQYDRKYLKDNNLYKNRPACELKFLTPVEHLRLHKKGVHRSEATKKAIAEALKGIPLSEEHRKAIGEAKSKKILQFTKSREFVREWPSAYEAERELGIAHSNICGCCNGKRKSTGGYIWKYAEDLSDILESLFEHYRDATTSDGVVF